MTTMKKEEERSSSVERPANVECVDQFQKELKELLNRHSMENDSNTPDFILATYLMNCLAAFNEAKNLSTEWHQRI